MAGQGEQRVAWLRLQRVELTVFPAEARKKKKMGLYLEIAKGERTPAEAVNLRERQSGAVKCSVVRGEPVDQVQVRGHSDQSRKVSQSSGQPRHGTVQPCPLPPLPSPEPFARTTLP